MYFLILVCVSGHYGTNCHKRCSGYCIKNEPCDHVSGVCPDGCKDGYTGKLCNNSTNFTHMYCVFSTVFKYATYHKLTNSSSFEHNY